MNRIDRLNAILIHIQGKPKVRLEELEDRFDVSRRTIFRDIRSLLEAGVPIGGDAGEGYFIVDGYHLPPVVFNKEEASALLLGEKFIEINADQQTIDLFREAMYKVKAVLRYSDKEFLEMLEQKISIRPHSHEEHLPNAHLMEIQQAIATNHVLRIEYHANYSDAITKREVEPLGMVFYSNRWHLIAHCRLRDDLRDFRADRIRIIRMVFDT
jgi:predicted DNA-binding transcriptional regulator YafY